MTQIKNQISIQSPPYSPANSPPGGGDGSGLGKDHLPETTGVKTLHATSSLETQSDKHLKTNKNVNLKNSKIMKKLFFSFVMMLALVIVAGTAMAQQNTTITQGGTYSYTLSGIVVNTAGTVTIDFTGDNAEIVTMTSGFSSTSPTAPAGTYNGVFTVKYSNSAISGNLVVTITDGSTLGCSNHISLPITVLQAPTINLAVTASESQYCQTTNGITPNIAASSGSLNTITYTVSRTGTNTPIAYTWGYTINIPDPTLNNYAVKLGGTDITGSLPYTRSGLASSSTSETYTVTFMTTTGAAPKSLTGSLTTAPTLTETSGGATYSETDSSDNSVTVTVKSTPAIGSFQ